jgi:uncharacterized protein YeaO (DUF488 family)
VLFSFMSLPERVILEARDTFAVAVVTAGNFATLSEAMHALQVKRVYEPPAPDDGVRVLVDRLWPRGLTKGRAAVDLWLKDLAPSVALRRWFNHDPAKWSEFRKRYAAELDRKQAAISALVGAVRHGRVTLVFGARDPHHNNAVALQGYLRTMLA